MCPEDVADLQTPVMQEIAMNLVSPSSTSFSHCLYVFMNSSTLNGLESGFLDSTSHFGAW